MKHMTEVGEASVDDVMDSLKGEYGKFRMFRKKPMLEALMTAEANGLLEESHYDLDANNELRMFYKVTDYGKQMIHDYIK
jgi:hypothetical protein